MATLENGKVTYGSGEALPTVGSTAYKQAQQGVLPTSASSNVASSTVKAPSPVPTVSPVVDGSRIGQPVTSPPAAYPTSNKASAALGTAVDTHVAGVEANPTVVAPTTPKEQNLSAIQTLMQKLSLKGQRTQEVNTAEGVDTKKATALAIENESIARARAWDKQIEEVRKNSQGMFGGAVEGRISELSRQKNSELADIAIRYKVAQDDYQGAVDIAKKKIDAEFEPLETEFNNRKDLFTMYQNDMTEKEKIDYQNKLTQDGKVLEDFKKAKSDYSEIAIQNGNTKAAQEILNTAKTGDDVRRIAAKYGLVSLDDKYKLSQIEEVKARTAKTLAEAQNNPDSAQNLGEQLVRGMIDPSQLSKRTANYNAVLKAADDYSMKTTGKHFDVAKANRDFKYASNVGTINTLNYLGSLTGGVGETGNLDELLNLSNSINRTKFPALNKAENWAKLETGDPAIASYHAVVTEVADQVGKILQGGGTGSGTSDAKLNQALSLFRSDFTKEQLAGVVNSIKPLLMNRAKNLIGDNPYLSDYSEKFGFKQSETAAPKEGDTKEWNGATYKKVGNNWVKQ